ncbi:hypothetical protein MFLO_02207 [Listeria floridensis FSL S10-1187]|uniref:Uncharacterized protein n=1 Tax=Listeria floridensis FSL S10-1187 TaxID=1265817 RepID=A0ABP3B0V1_9LIST|nr:DUF3116 family protein [Listeria floridensis]EUJ33566.1 hypothetical protein MFLO_02207 [Listeria floridensis FSL S10-1187]
MALSFHLAFRIVENVYRGPSNMNELVNDRAKDETHPIPNKTEFLLAIYQLEEIGLLFRYRSNDGIRYSRTEEGEAFYNHYRVMEEKTWPKFLL